MDHFEHIRVQTQGDTVFVNLCDKYLVDDRSIAELQIELLSTIFELKPKRLIVNFASVERILTEVVNVLIFTRQQLMQRSGVLAIRDMQRPVAEVFSMLHLDFDIHETTSTYRVLRPEVA